MLLLIYLHMMGCLFFFCLKTYEVSSTRIDIIDELGLRQKDEKTNKYTYLFEEY